LPLLEDLKSNDFATQDKIDAVIDELKRSLMPDMLDAVCINLPLIEESRIIERVRGTNMHQRLKYGTQLVLAVYVHALAHGIVSIWICLGILYKAKL